MSIESQLAKRLEFLQTVIDKEIALVDFAAQQVFETPFTVERAKLLDQEPMFALKLEAFTSRFCRLQDTLGDKLLPALLKALGEPIEPFITNLNKAEKFGWLESAESWVGLRQLRNQMIHEYIEDLELLADAVQTAFEQLDSLKMFAQKMKMAEVSLSEAYQR